jgi:hypothetical protein
MFELRLADHHQSRFLERVICALGQIISVICDAQVLRLRNRSGTRSEPRRHWSVEPMAVAPE